MGDRIAEATTLNNIGLTYSELGEKQKALDYYQQALSLHQAEGDRSGEASTLHNLGLLYSDLGEQQKALDYYQQALLLRREVGNRSGEAVTLSGIGLVYSDLGEYQTALEYYQQALPLAQAVGNRAREATILNNMGGVYSNLGDMRKALDYYQQALLLHQAVENRAGEANTLNNIASVYADLGDPQHALDYYQQVLSLARSVSDRQEEARVINNIGSVYSDLGDNQKALQYYQQALPLYQAIGDRSGEATVLDNIGSVYGELGESHKALEYHLQALPLRRAVGDRAGEASTLVGIGIIYLDWGDARKALDYHQQALLLSQAIGECSGEASALNNIGTVYMNIGEPQQALDYLLRSLPLLQAVGARAKEATTLNNIGAAYWDIGEKRKALDYLLQALPISQEVGDRTGEARTLNNIGQVYSDLGEKQKALDYLQQALPLRRAVGDRAGEASTLYNIALAEHHSGNLQAALTQIQAAIDIIEDLRTKIGSQELRASYFAQNQDYYEFYINLLMELHRQNPDAGYDSPAFHISERARARGLLELLAEASADIRQGVDPELLAKDRDLRQQLNAADSSRTQLLTRNSGYTATELEAVKQEIDSLLNQLQTLEGQIRANSPRYAELQYPQPLTLSQIQQQLLDDDTLLLQYSLGEKASYLWAVSKTGMTSYQLPPRAEIEAAAQPFLDYLKSEDGANPEAGIPLSQILLAPVADRLKGQRLAIVGDAILQTIPFAALPIPAGGSPAPPALEGKGVGGLGLRQFANNTNNTPTLLLENHEIVTLPSASSLAISRQELANRPVAPKTLAVLADPVFDCLDPRLANVPGCNADTTDPEFGNNANQPWNSVTRTALFLNTACTSYNRLPYTETEANEILALVPDNQRFEALGFEASLTTATSDELSHYQIVHLATHGCVGKEHPSLQGLVLSQFAADGTLQDGFLRLADIFNLNLPAELVVLSACQTGIGENLKGEGIVGLTRGFMYAGAKRVAVSLWSVNDSATAELMGNFYQKMLGEGFSPTAALRQAQLEAWKAGSPPYEWAAFVLQGEWRD